MQNIETKQTRMGDVHRKKKKDFYKRAKFELTPMTSPS